MLLHKNDENNRFEEQVLLQKVPKTYKRNAQRLLEIFDNHPEQITWSNVGTLFIDGVAIPNSDINSIFPKLFERTSQNNFNIRGLEELVLQIQLMGYGNLILRKYHVVSLDDISSDDSENPWWYIGP